MARRWPTVAALSLGAVLLACALVAPTGQAQLPSLPIPVPSQSPPPNSVAGTLTITPTETKTLEVAVGAPASRQLVVRFDANPTNTPLDQPRHVEIAIDNIPAGWNAHVSPTALELAPGAQDFVTLTVTVDPSAAGGADFQLTARSAARNPLDSDLSATAVVKASHVDPLTRTLLEGIGPYIIVLIVTVPILLLVIVLLAVRRPGGAVQLQADLTVANLHAGGRAAFPFTVRNLGRRSQTIVLAASKAGTGWSTILPEPEVEVPGRGSLDTQLVLVAPADAVPGAKQSVVVTAHATEDPKHPATVTFDMRIVPPGTPADAFDDLDAGDEGATDRQVHAGRPERAATPGPARSGAKDARDARTARKAR